MSGLAAVAALAAAALLFSGPRPFRVARGRRWMSRVAALAPALAACGWATSSIFGARVLALVTLAALAAGAAAQLLRRDRSRRRENDLRREVVEICESLAGEVRAGSPPDRAVTRAAEMWPVLTGVAQAAALGADIPTALRTLSRRPGAESLAVTAAAWEVSQTVGSGLAGALERCAEVARSDLATAELVTGELATARATARLLALLPVVVLAMGGGMGLDPWSFLLGSWPGVVCLALGLAFAWIGLRWIDRIGEAVVR